MGVLPVTVTPVERAAHVSDALGCDVYVKRDDLSHPRYGGNKVRKLDRLLAEARDRGATDVITYGAAGSHHVLATTVHGTALGFVVHAVLVPQHGTAHVEHNLRADLAQGTRIIPAAGMWQAPLLVARELLRLRAAGRRPYVIPVGGSSPLGAAGYVAAVRELALQIARGAMPGWPDVMVCALGSGGTLAGILAGVHALQAPTRVVGVRVTAPWMTPRLAVAWMANAALRLAEPALAREHGPVSLAEVHVVDDQLGAGYGRPTAQAREALELFARDGLALDLTYTAKAAAGLIAMARNDPTPRRYLFWDTLSSAPLEPLLDGAPEALPAPLRALLLD